MTVHLIHGIHATEPGGNTAKLAIYLRAMGHKVEVHSYGYAFASTSALPGWTNHLNRGRAEKCAKRIKDGDSVVCHSNGAAVTYLIQEPPLRTLKDVVLIQPALDRNAVFHNTERVLCIYNEQDDVVGLSSILPGNHWGAMGKLGPDDSHHNMEKKDALDPSLGLPLYRGHHGLFEKANIAAWATSIGSWLNNKGGENNGAT